MLETITNQAELERRLRKDAQSSDIDNVVIALHFPLRANRLSLYEATETWGPFSLHTAKLGIDVGKELRDSGKNVKFLFLCDDWSYRDEDKELLAEKQGLSNSRLDNRWKITRSRFYRQISGPNASLPHQYKQLFTQYDFSEADVLRHNHGKPGREDCLYFSEQVLRSDDHDTCSEEYFRLIEDELNTRIDNYLLVSFVPHVCQTAICRALNETEDLNGMHVFMGTEGIRTLDELYEAGVMYKKDLPEAKVIRPRFNTIKRYAAAACLAFALGTACFFSGQEMRQDFQTMDSSEFDTRYGLRIGYNLRIMNTQKP